VGFTAPTRDAVAAAFAERIREVADSERARRATLCGPHRDDVGLTLDGASLSDYGSQGQQRTAVLALKIAEYAVLHERCGEAPLLLLDDVLSELDETRAAALLGEISGYEQAFLTATHVPNTLEASVHVARVNAARIERYAC
jgi:DNA replication and repair protein RecF